MNKHIHKTNLFYIGPVRSMTRLVYFVTPVKLVSILLKLLLNPWVVDC